MADKPPYKLTYKLDSARADLVGEAMERLRDIASDHDQTGAGSATITIESWQEAPILEIRDAFEFWLATQRVNIEHTHDIKVTGVRPETEARIARGARTTPMDTAGWESTTTTEAPEEDGDWVLASAPQLPPPAAEHFLEADYTTEGE